MDIRESIKNTLNESNLTSPSKLYTPFTLFAVYFAIYFKAEILGQIFLSDNWDITAQALAKLGDPGPLEWFIFASKVAGYSIGMLVLYGVAQFLAVGIWALSNRLNTRINAELHRGKYVATSILEKAEERIEELRSDNRKLYTELATYHTWKPEDISRLKEELEYKNESLKNTLEELNSAEEEIENSKKSHQATSDDLTVALSDLTTQTGERNDFESSNRTIFELYNYTRSIRSYRNTVTQEEIVSLFDDKNIVDHIIGIISGPSKKIIKFNSEKLDFGYAIGLIASTTKMIETLTLNDNGLGVVVIQKNDKMIKEFLQLLPEPISNKLEFHAF